MEQTVATRRKRIWEIDFVRGLCLAFMIVDHFFYDFSQLPSVLGWIVPGSMLEPFLKFAAFYWAEIHTFAIAGIRIQYIFVALFIIISGISTHFSKSSLKRSFQVLAGAYLISLVTYLIGNMIHYSVLSIPFGILHTIGYSMLIYSLLQKISKSKYLDLVMFVVVMISGWILSSLGLKNPDVSSNPLDRSFYLALLGVGRLVSADFFGMLPWLGYFFLGGFIGKTVYHERKSFIPTLDGKWNRPFLWLGKNSIWVYLTHQVVIFVIVVLVGLIFGYQIRW